ncbi:MAG TPA: hypothetical protein VHC18_06465, partial [Amycolatopsis sp.]|nr:hypothetical protein [Amycolatopsis sp.]
MHYDAMQDEAGGGTRFVSYDLEQYPAEIETGVPPLLVTSPMSAGQVRFVDIPEDVKEVPPHPAPTRQFVVALTGVYEAVA